MKDIKKIEMEIANALHQHEYYLNQGMVMLAMEYLNYASGLQRFLLNNCGK